MNYQCQCLPFHLRNSDPSENYSFTICLALLLSACSNLDHIQFSKSKQEIENIEKTCHCFIAIPSTTFIQLHKNNPPNSNFKKGWKDRWPEPKCAENEKITVLWTCIIYQCNCYSVICDGTLFCTEKVKLGYYLNTKINLDTFLTLKRVRILTKNMIYTFNYIEIKVAVL